MVEHRTQAVPRILLVFLLTVAFVHFFRLLRERPLVSAADPMGGNASARTTLFKNWYNCHPQSQSYLQPISCNQYQVFLWPVWDD